MMGLTLVVVLHQIKLQHYKFIPRLKMNRGTPRPGIYLRREGLRPYLWAPEPAMNPPIRIRHKTPLDTRLAEFYTRGVEFLKFSA